MTSPGWKFLGYFTRQAECKIAADGTGAAAFAPVDPNELWQVTRAIVACTGGGTPSAVLHVTGSGTTSPATQRSGTSSGRFDEADYAGDGLAVMGNEQLVATWAGATAGATAIATITFRRLRQG